VNTDIHSELQSVEVGRVTPCAPLPVDPSVEVYHAGAHGVTRPTRS